MTTHNGRRRRFLIVLVVCFLLVVNVTLGFILTMKSSDALTSLIQGRMRDVSNTAASMIDGDALASLTAEDIDTDDYQKIKAILRQFEDHTGLEYVYCIRAEADGSFTFTVDPTDDNPAQFGDTAIYTEARARASQGVPSVDEVSYSDAWGEFYSAYSPVFGSDGEVAGIVAVDFDANWYDQQIASLVHTVVAVAVLSLLGGVALVVSLTRREVERYHMLHRQLNVLASKVEQLMHEIDDAYELPELQAAPKRPLRRIAFGDDDVDLLGEKVLAMQEDIRAHIELIKAQAYLDGLTGLGNKAAHLAAVQHLDKQIAQGEAHFAVAVFDLNGLKQINDTYGHECGDQALTDATLLLRRVFGEKGLYRVGGDEFIALVDPAGEQDMRRLMALVDEALVEANREAHPYVLPLALSKGSAVYDPAVDDSCQAVSRRADHLMYENKAAYYRSVGDRRRR